MRSILNKASLVVAFIAVGVTAFGAQEPEQLIEEKVVRPLKALHDPANIKMFSRAYIGSVWKYELKSKPAGKVNYYEYLLREYRGAFIIDQYKMRVDLKAGTVLVEDWKNTKYLAAADWVTFYKTQKGKK